MDSLFSLGIVTIFVVGIIRVVNEVSARPQQKPNDHRRFSYYRARTSLLDERERAFYLELSKHLPHGWHIFPKMRIADVLETTNGRGYKRLLSQILSKHIDFVITDFNFRPVCAIELNGMSHNASNRQFSDTTKREVFTNAGFPLYIVKTGSNFSNEIQSILIRSRR